ncbi:glycosyltransferase [uncultured Parasphingopyxis sp.]|uniref:glycosyltransferase n=1 Tax=uncultured Parasphingopyxis sp. TaxID=1547918 RepID=UPI0026076632|nr:glycosyltransferase [uncultured Parasphingopyxis sp.]
MLSDGDGDAVAASLAGLVRKRFLTHGEVARRTDALFDDGYSELAWFLLDAAQSAAPESHVLAGRRFRRLGTERGLGAVRAYAEKILQGDASAEMLLHVVAALGKAGIDPADSLAIRAGEAFEQATAEHPDERQLRDRLYAKMGYDALRRWRAIERSAPDRSLRAIVSEAGWDDPLGQAFDRLAVRIESEEPSYEPTDRLLLVGNSLACGGMERVLAKTYRHYAEGSEFEAVDLALLQFDEAGSTGFYADMAGVKAADVLLLDRNYPAGDKVHALPANLAGRTQQLIDHIERTRLRVIHAWNDQVGVLAAFAGLVAGCPKVIVHFHHTPVVPLSSLTGYADSFPAVYRTLLRQPAFQPLFCADAAAKAYAQWWNVQADRRLRTLYNGFDWPQGRPKAAAKAALGIGEDVPVIGTVMRFHDVKQPLLWAEAAIALAAPLPGARFLMVGDGPLQAETAARFAEAGIGDALTMPGQVENVGDYYAAMDVFWLTSKSEGLPNVCVEAQFFGVPVIAFDVGGMGETFVDGETGALVPPGDIEALATRTAEWLANGAEAGQMAQAARAFAERTFSAERYFTELTDIYRAP